MFFPLPGSKLHRGISTFCFFAAQTYQTPEAMSVTAQPDVNKIKKVEGSMNHATMAAAADNPPQRKQ